MHSKSFSGSSSPHHFHRDPPRQQQQQSYSSSSSSSYSHSHSQSTTSSSPHATHFRDRSPRHGHFGSNRSHQSNKNPSHSGPNELHLSAQIDQTNQNSPLPNSQTEQYEYRSTFKFSENQSKAILRDYVVHLNQPPPNYVLTPKGPSHDQYFEGKLELPFCEVLVTLLAKTKKETEKGLATAALKSLYERKKIYVEGIEALDNQKSTGQQLPLPDPNSNLEDERRSSNGSMDAIENVIPSPKRRRGSESSSEDCPLTLDLAKNVLQYSYHVLEKKTPIYQVVSQKDSNSPSFLASVQIPRGPEDKEIRFVHATAPTKKEAEKEVALRACLELAKVGKLFAPASLKLKMPSFTSSTTATEESKVISCPPTSTQKEPAEEGEIEEETFHVVCSQCKVFLCTPQDLYFGKHLTILNSTIWKRLVLKPHPEIANLDKKFQLCCLQCNNPLGSIVESKGGERVCFKKIYVSIQSTNEKNPKVFTPQEFSGMVGQLNCFKITSNLNLDPKTIIQPPQPNSTLYVYQVKFLTGVETFNPPYMRNHVFDGFVLYSSHELNCPDFNAIKQKNNPQKRSLTPISLVFKETTQLDNERFERLKDLHEFFFFKFLKIRFAKEENSFLMEAFLTVPHFLIAEGEQLVDKGSILDDIDFIQWMKHGEPLSPILHQLRKEFTFSQLRSFEERQKELTQLTPEEEEMKKVIQSISETLEKRACVTTYNGNIYFISEVSYTIPIDSILHFYEKRGLTVQDMTQPLLVSNFKFLKEEDYETEPKKENEDQMTVVNYGTFQIQFQSKFNNPHQQHPKLIPEFCNLVAVSVPMIHYGTFMREVFSHLYSLMERYARINSWQSKIGVSVTNQLLIKQAFTHPSFSNEKEVEVTHNEKLEFLGDAIIDFVVSHYLFKKLKGLRESQLVNKRTAFVNNHHLAKIAVSLDMVKLILFPPNSDPEMKFETLADVFEAFVAAIFLNQGLEIAQKFVRKHIFSRIHRHKPSNPKKRLRDGSSDRFSCYHEFDILFNDPEEDLSEKEKEFIQPLNPSSEYPPPESRKQQWDELEQVIGYKFKDRALLQFAMTHSTVTKEVGRNYERLEWLGDSILKFLISLHLYKEYPTAQEGELSKRRSLLVMNETLGEVGMKLNLHKCVRYRGKEYLDKNSKVISDLVEALIAAIFMDGGFETKHSGCACGLDVAGSFLHKFIIPSKQGFLHDPKSQLQHLVQATYGTIPVYQAFPVQQDLWRCKLLINGKVVVEGEATTERDSQRQVAQIGAELFLQNKI